MFLKAGSELHLPGKTTAHLKKVRHKILARFPLATEQQNEAGMLLLSVPLHVPDVSSTWTLQMTYVVSVPVVQCCGLWTPPVTWFGEINQI